MKALDHLQAFGGDDWADVLRSGGLPELATGEYAKAETYLAFTVAYRTDDLDTLLDYARACAADLDSNQPVTISSVAASILELIQVGPEYRGVHFDLLHLLMKLLDVTTKK